MSRRTIISSFVAAIAAYALAPVPVSATGDCCQGAGWCASNTGFDAADMAACTGAGGAVNSSQACDVVSALCVSKLAGSHEFSCSSDAPKGLCDELAEPVELDEPPLNAVCQQANPDDNLGICNSGCETCGEECTQTWAEIKEKKQLQLADNLGWADEKFDLIIYQQTNKGEKGDKDWFQWYASKWLQGKAPVATHWAVNNIAEALAAIKNAYAANGNNPINVIIVGHGAPGSIKVGEEQLNKGNYDTALANVSNMIKRLVLFGCSVAADGKKFVDQLSEFLDAPVKSWTDTVWASTKGLYYEGEKNVLPEPCCLPDDTCVELTNADCLATGGTPYGIGATCAELEAKGGCAADIPTVSEWGLIVLGLLVLAAGSIAVMRRQPASA